MSIISYFGGKANFQSFITPNIPKDCTTYIEPFSGSFAIYLDSKLEFNTVVFNDRNRHQANLIRCCASPLEFLPELKALLAPGGLLYTEVTTPEEKWDFYTAIYRDYIRNTFLDDMDFEIGDFKVAAIYAFLITSSFSSVYPRGGGFTGYKKAKDKLNLTILMNKLEKNKYTERLQKISEFNNLDFEEVITKYDSPTTYFYADPPYYIVGEGNYYSNHDFDREDHERLAIALNKVQGKFSLSYYDFELLHDWFPENKYRWEKKEFAKAAAAKKGTKQNMGEELLILNY